MGTDSSLLSLSAIARFRLSLTRKAVSGHPRQRCHQSVLRWPVCNDDPTYKPAQGLRHRAAESTCHEPRALPVSKPLGRKLSKSPRRPFRINEDEVNVARLDPRRNVSRQPCGGSGLVHRQLMQLESGLAQTCAGLGLMVVSTQMQERTISGRNPLDYKIREISAVPARMYYRCKSRRPRRLGGAPPDTEGGEIAGGQAPGAKTHAVGAGEQYGGEMILAPGLRRFCEGVDVEHRGKQDFVPASAQGLCRHFSLRSGTGE